MKKAFTLAEVLLTLAIIGVVAALTIPAVITKVTQDQYVTGLKKAWNTMKTVEMATMREHGDIDNQGWPGSRKEFFEKYYKEYFDILKICVSVEKGCWAAETTYLNGEAYETDWNTSYYYRFMTSDGMAWAFNYGDFYVDVNGLKGPNRWGRDIFNFDESGTPKGYKPHGHNRTTAYLNENCNPSDLTNGFGNSCAAKVLNEGAMNY